MTNVFVIEVEGRGVMTFEADNKAEADMIIHEGSLGEDLMALESSGRPLWDGVSELRVRLPLPDELARHQESSGRALLKGQRLEEEDWIYFLVPVSDPMAADNWHSEIAENVSED